jgi:hypothetical protein
MPRNTTNSQISPNSQIEETAPHRRQSSSKTATPQPRLTRAKDPAVRTDHRSARWRWFLTGLQRRNRRAYRVNQSYARQAEKQDQRGQFLEGDAIVDWWWWLGLGQSLGRSHVARSSAMMEYGQCPLSNRASEVYITGTVYKNYRLCVRRITSRIQLFAMMILHHHICTA